MKKTLIVCSSFHHENTLKIAKAISQVINAEIKKPEEINIDSFVDYDLVGFGSGIYNHMHDKRIFNLVEKLPNSKNKKTFIFSTNSFGLLILHKDLKQKLIEKGFDIIGEFSCPGFMDYSFCKYFFGGISKNRPNEKDIKKAQEFAKTILTYKNVSVDSGNPHQ